MPTGEVEVKTADEFIQKLQDTSVNTIDIGADISLEGKNLNSISRDITIKGVQKGDGTHWGLDFNNTYLTDNGNNVILDNLNLYARSSTGALYFSGGNITLKNTNFYGERLLYVDSGARTTLNFEGNVAAATVLSYKIGNSSYTINDGINSPHLLIAGWPANLTINFKEGSNVNLTSLRNGIILNSGSQTAINVEKNAKVTMNPHGVPNSAINYNAAAISINGGTLSIEGDLVVNCSQEADLSSASEGMTGLSQVEVKDGGNLTITSSGTETVPLINCTGNIIIDNNATLNFVTKNEGDYNGALVSGNVTLSPHAHVNMTADGTGNITGFSSLTADNPDEINIDLSGNTGTNSRAIASGKITESSGETRWIDGKQTPAKFKDMDISFDGAGNPIINKLDVLSDQDIFAKDSYHYQKEFYIKAGDPVSVTDKVDIASDTFDPTTDQVTGVVTADTDNDDICVNILVNGKQVFAKDNPDGIVGGEYQHIVNNSEKRYTTKTKDKSGKFAVDVGQYANELKGNMDITIQVMKNGVTKETHITLMSLKEAAKEAIEKAKQVADDAIKNMPGLTEENKKSYQAKVDQEAAEKEKALEADTVKTLDDINKIKNEAVTNINKDEAKAEIKEEAEKVKKSIKDFEDQKDVVSKIDQEEQRFEKELDTKTTSADIKKAVTDDKVAIDKDGAIAAIDHEAKVVKDGLGQGADTSQIDQEQNKAHTAINGASDQAGVNSAETNGTFNIDVQGEIAKIKKAAQDADNKIDQDQTLTEDDNVKEGTTAKDRVDQERDQIIEKIKKELEAALKNPTTIADTLKHIKAEANDIINTINREPAKAEVEHAARVEKEKIKNNKELTEPEKNEAEGKVDTDLTEAENAINKETDNTKIESTKTAGINKIGLEEAKATAKEHVRQEAKKEKAVVDGLQPLTKEEQETYDQNIEKAKNDALNNIDNAKDEKGIIDAENAGKTSIDRESAKAAIDNEAEQVTQIVEGLKNVDEKTKQAAEDKIKSDQEKFKKQIDDPTQTNTKDKVNSTKQAGIKQIDADGQVASDADTNVKNAKETAEKELEDAKNKAEEDVKDQKVMPDLSDQEKQEIIKKIEDDYKKAKDAVSNSKSTDAVNQARDTGKATISQDENKAKAHDAIDKEVKRAEAGIDKLPEDEKKAAEDKIAQDAKKAHADVDNASDQNSINKAQNDGVNNIARDGAIAQINHEANKVTNEIDGLKNVDSKAQEDAKNQVAKDKQDAINKINASDVTSIDQVTHDGITKIDNDDKVAKTADDAINSTKQEANKAIDDQANQAKNEVDKKHLSDQEKEDIKKQIDQDAQKAHDAINNAKGNDAVKKAEKDGETNIKDDVNKAEAKSAINDETDKVKKTIDSLPNLTPDEKKKHDDQVDSDAKDAKDNIDQATDQNTVIDAKNKGIAKIDKDGQDAKANDNLDKAKNDAKKEIDDQTTKTKGEIDNSKNLSDQDKKNFKDQVDQIAKDEIDKVTDSDGVNSAKTDGLNTIKQQGKDAETADTNKANDSKNSQDNTGKTDTNGGKDGSTNANSNGAKTNDTGSMSNRYSSSLGAEDNGEAKVAVIGDKESDSRNKLPQAGAKKDDTLGVIGLAIVVAGSLLGLGISKKRREK